ncbi:unnamed protein product [Orchesella dallaii]|uniref:Uncharacterized protein n=1 Tax=Orchesella dallaii TaxID=48710 RepID=A0ABP1QSU7_9HEXA
MTKLYIYTFIPTLIVFFTPTCFGLASEAFYTIQNEGTQFCLSAGPVIRFEPEIKSVFKDGLVATRDCSTTKNLTAIDSSQEWLVKILKEDPRNFNFNVLLRMRNTVYIDKEINAELRGEFISYFPNALNLKGDQSMEESSQSQQFIITDTHTNKCLTDSETTQAYFGNCDDSFSKFQWWNFTLINNIDAMKADQQQQKQQH